MVLNKRCLAERQNILGKQKRPSSFLTNDNHLFYNASAGERAGPTEDKKQDLDLSKGQTLFVNLVYGL